MSSKGNWRERFNPDKALEFIEIYRDDVLEFVGSIQRLEVDRGAVTISGFDAWSLLRRAYERDRTWIASPRDVIDAYTRVPTVSLADDFDGAALSGWTLLPNTTATVSLGAARVTVTSGWGDAGIRKAIGTPSDTWSAEAVVREDAFTDAIFISVTDAGGEGVIVAARPLAWEITDWPITQRQSAVASSDRSLPMNIKLERQGRWATASINGRRIGRVTWPVGATGALTFSVYMTAESTLPALIVESVRVVSQTPFLTRGSDRGRYDLPGDYPTGGLRGRYYSHADLQGLPAADRAGRIPDPDAEPIVDRMDEVIDIAANPAPPGSGDWYSVRWSGAIYLRGDLGNYTFEATGTDDGIRLWVGKTAWGDQLIDAWQPGAGTRSAVWSASAHGSRAGWYPIVVEYYEDAGAQVFALQWTPPSNYTDRGGGIIVGATKTPVQGTSLSPLGCFDNRVQGQSHFDVIQQAMQQFGYQMTCEPMQFESGEFPGRLVPRHRAGRDTDLILRVDDDDLDDPVLSPGVTYDASDQAVSLIGAGAGQPDGRSQLTNEITDTAGAATSLFVLERWMDAGEIAFASLLDARMNAELALSASPWEEVRGTPRAQEALADTWPLSSALSAMRWRPGDGIRLSVPDIGVEDAEPRQLVQVTRTFGAHGRTGTQVGLRQRPRSAAKSLAYLIRAGALRDRSYQGQKVTLSGQFANLAGAGTAPGAGTDYSMLTLLSSDRVIRAVLRIAINVAAQPLGLLINGNNVTAAVGGPWSAFPVEIDVTGYARPVSSVDQRMYAQLVNNGSVSSAIQFQLIVEVQR